MKKLMQDDIIISLNDDSGAVVDKMTTTNFIDKMYMNKEDKYLQGFQQASALPKRFLR